MRKARSGKTILDVCSKCRGIWFEPGIFVGFVTQLAENGNLKPSETRLFNKRVVQRTDRAGPRKIRCPRCGEYLRPFNYAVDSNVFLDKCSHCGGIWSDAGEAARVARYLKTDPQIDAVAQHIVRHGGEGANTKEHFGDIRDIANILTRPVSPAVLFMPRIVLPLSDDIVRQSAPLMTLSLIALCTLAYLGQLGVFECSGRFFYDYGFVPWRFLDISVITSMFLHGGIFHLLGNMWFLWLFGDNVEDRLGKAGFSVFYIGCGLAASLLHSVVNTGSDVPAIGASGAISGVMGAYLVYYPHSRIKMLMWYSVVHVPAVSYIVVWFGLQVWAGVSTAGGYSNVGWFAHIGGFVSGALFAFFHRMHGKENIEQSISVGGKEPSGLQ